MSMKTINVRLSKFQREELSHKLDIMAEGFGADGNVEAGYMAASYGFKRSEELEAFNGKLWAKPKAPSCIVTMDEREARAAWGEFENAYDIAADNAESDWGDDDGYASAAKRLKQAMQRIEEAATAAGFDATTTAVAA